jgi:hypothetical protein
MRERLYGCGYGPANNFWGSVYLPAPAVSLGVSSDVERPLAPNRRDEFQPERATGPTPKVPVIWSGSPGMAYVFCRKWYRRECRPW